VSVNPEIKRYDTQEQGIGQLFLNNKSSYYVSLVKPKKKEPVSEVVKPK
jgi:hypothetical protein